MKLATWNVNSLKARMPRLLEFLDQHRPDVMCLQETKAGADAFPHGELAEVGYAAADHSGGRWAGVALLAPQGTPLTNVCRGLEGEIDAGECRWIEADVAGLRVASTYVPNGRAVGTATFAAKLQFLEAIADRTAALLSAAGRRPLIVAGDFNVTPTDLDVYDAAMFVGSTHVTPDERRRLQRILDNGLVDAYRHLHPDEVGFTWWDYRAGHFHKRLGLRIDLLLVSSDLAGRIATCGIDRNYRKGKKPSDHAPLLLDLAGWDSPTIPSRPVRAPAS